MTPERAKEVLQALQFAIQYYHARAARTDIVGEACLYGRRKKITRDEVEELLAKPLGETFDLHRAKYKPRKKT